MARRTNNAFGRPLFSPLDVLDDPIVTPLLKTGLHDICGELEIIPSNIEALQEILWHRTRGQSVESFELTLQSAFSAAMNKSALTNALDRRAKLIAKQIRPFIVGNSVADIGCGDGMVSWYIKSDLQNHVLLDVLDYRDARVTLPFFLYSENTELPVTQPVDTSLLLTVLHHAADPIHLLNASANITLKRLIVIESVYGVHDSNTLRSGLSTLADPEEQRKYATFVDWLYNRILHRDVSVPYNYLTPPEWIRLFETHGWDTHEFIDLGIDQPLVPEHHVLFVLEPSHSRR